MNAKRVVLFFAAFAVTGSTAGPSSPEEPLPLYNTAKAKLLSGKPIVGGTVYTSDPNIYCAMADAGFDFLWIEMQHSPLTYDQVAKMIRTCRGARAVPFIRVPDATEGDIQKATDIGALGIIVPMVESVKEAEDSVRFAKYPPAGRRSQGGGQYGELWGSEYRKSANDNILMVAMIESPEAAGIAADIAAVEGIDVVFAASGDLGSFTGYSMDDPRYQAIIQTIQDETLKAGKKLGGPFNWIDREGFSFFQASGEAALIKAGAKAMFESAKGHYEY